MKKHAHTVKTVVLIIILIIAIWALVVAYQAKELAKWVDDKQQNVIEMLLHKQ
jgi:F0F1-type ATP synthase membrane subunit a